MSYDLTVFDPDLAPNDRESFMAWFRENAKWQEDHDYNDPEVASSKLKAWFRDMIATYPAMNGPLADPDFDSPKVTDYSVGRTMIYCAFRWSELHNAYATVLGLAMAHGVGFFDTSADDGEVWQPNASGEYACAHGTGRSSEELGQVRIFSIQMGQTKKPD